MKFQTKYFVLSKEISIPLLDHMRGITGEPPSPFSDDLCPDWRISRIINGNDFYLQPNGGGKSSIVPVLHVQYNPVGRQLKIEASLGPRVYVQFILLISLIAPALVNNGTIKMILLCAVLVLVLVFRFSFLETLNYSKQLAIAIDSI